MAESRNQFCDPGFLFHFYSDMGLRRLLLPFLFRAGPDLEISCKTDKVRFLRLFPFLTTRYRKSRKPREMIFASLVAGWELY